MSQRAELLLDGKRTGFKILFTDEHELKFKGKGPRDVFEWVAENDDSDVTIGGREGAPLLPVRRETFSNYVAIATELVATTTENDYDYAMDEVYVPPSVLAPDGEADKDVSPPQVAGL